MHRIPRRRPRAPEPSKKFVFRLIKHPCSAEEKARYDNLGCKPRGRRCDGYFNHKTGKGWVAGHRGHYDDALRVKKNIVCILLHETSSGFSPPSATKIRRMGRAALSGVDRTPYTTRITTQEKVEEDQYKQESCQQQSKDTKKEKVKRWGH